MMLLSLLSSLEDVDMDSTHMILTVRNLGAEAEGKRRPVEIVLVLNVLQTLHTQVLTVRKTGLAFVVMNRGFSCVRKTSALSASSSPSQPQVTPVPYKLDTWT